MKQQKLIHIDGVGAISLERSTRAKNIIISIKPFRRPRVAVPPHSSFKEAEVFAISKSSWIKNTFQKMKRKEQVLSDGIKTSTPVDRREAEKVLQKRTQELASKHGFSYTGITIHNQKTLWGSCSVKNNISLNMQLARLPEDLIDYVILHELIHTRIKNHSRLFWQEVDRLVGNSKELRARLRNYLPRVQ